MKKQLISFKLVHMVFLKLKNGLNGLPISGVHERDEILEPERRKSDPDRAAPAEVDVVKRESAGAGEGAGNDVSFDELGGKVLDGLDETVVLVEDAVDRFSVDFVGFLSELVDQTGAERVVEDVRGREDHGVEVVVAEGVWRKWRLHFWTQIYCVVH